MAVNNITQQPAYALNQPTVNVPYTPIVSRRAPLPADKAPIGQIWIATPTNSFYILTSIVAGVSTWVTLSGGTGTFTTVTVTGGDLSVTAGNASVSGTITSGSNITITSGDFIAAAAGRGIILGGGAKVVSGTGDPNATITAPKGSLYLRLDGSSASTRAYINTNSSTAWTAITTAS